MRELLQLHSRKIQLASRVSFFSLLIIISYIAFLPNYNALPSFTSLSDVFNHFIAFFVLAMFLDFSFTPRYTYNIVFLSMYGIFIECVQYFLPNRAFDMLDVVVDISGVVIYLLLKTSFTKQLQKELL